MPYRDVSREEAPRRFDYVPRPRRWYHRLADLAVVVLVLYVVYENAWHWQLDCAWQGTRASCTRVSEDSFGRRKVQQINGIRGLAFHQGTHVGFVTDADHADELALFDTSEVVLGSVDDAEEVRRFAEERYPKSVGYRAGLPRPVFVSAFGLLAIFAWAFFTRTRRFRITVDPRSRTLVLSRGVLRGTERFELGDVNVELEHGGPGIHRVLLQSKSRRVRVTEQYHSGTHHAALVRAVAAAIAPPPS